MSYFVLAGLLFLLLCFGVFLYLQGMRVHPYPGAQISGFARVTDGDNIVLGQQEFRLAALDSPEWNQSEPLGNNQVLMTGLMAKNALARKVNGRWVTVQVESRDPYGRWIATVFLQGEDVNAWMVRQGYAMAYAQYSRQYLDEQRDAQKMRRGMWQSQRSPVSPWAWRRAGRHLQSS